MEEFVAKNPKEDRRLHPGELGKITGKFSGMAYESYIPYELLPAYVRGKRAG